jgi:hypothetical protein
MSDDLVTIRGIRFQVLRDDAGRVTDIIAMRVGATMPVFVALKPTSLIFDSAARERIIEIFRDEEGRHLAAQLECAATTVWGIRVALGIATKQLDESRTTHWRHSKLTRRSEPAGPPIAGANEEEQE